MGITIDNIVDDIMLSLRGNNISESESINRIQIELFIDRYRAVLLKQDIDKGEIFNDSYIQGIDDISMEVDESFVGYPHKIKSKVSIPSTVDFNRISGILGIYDSFGNEIQISTIRRAYFQKNRKYTSSDPIAYINSGILYILGDILIDSVNIRGIFEHPTSVPGFDRYKDEYPIPVNIIPVMKQLILEKEFGIIRYSDKTNNSDNDTEGAQVQK